LFLGADYK